MPKTRTYGRSFAGGEISPEMFGRIDDDRFQTGAARVRNFIATPQGPAENRPGFAYVNATKNNGVARLIPFIYSVTQTMVIELGDSYIRFHTQGATLLYDAGQRAFIPSATVTISVASPGVVTWAGHQLQTGDPVGFSISSGGALPTGIAAGTTYKASVIDANTFNILDPVSGNPVNVTAAGSGVITGFFYYSAGDLVTFGGAVYYRTPYQEGSSGSPSTSPQMWYQLPADLTYEIPSPYVAADLFDIHYVQSADVMTLVHPNYPPAELSRDSATVWTYRAIDFAPAILPPATISVMDSPGFKVGISAITLANPAVITTSANHTLVLGDGVYVKGLTAVIGGVSTPLDGFYMVNLIPQNPSTGQDILNQLELMDYSGNVLDSSGWSSWSGPATIQYGTKIFNIDDTYVVTAVSSDQVSESQVSAETSVINNLDVQGAYNVITWSAVPGASRYQVYKKLNGLYGYIGETGDLTFTDDNIAPDMGITPPIYDNVLTGADNYPGGVAYFEQRRVFAGSLNQPQNVWMTKVGTESDFSYSLPTQDSDRIAIRVSQLQSDRVMHVLPMADLLMLTSGAEIRISSVDNTEALTPSTISARPGSYIGSSTVQPQIVNNVTVFCAARGGHVRELGYSWQANGYVTGDLSLRAAHLFDNLSISDMAYMKAPRPILWFVSSNGNLLGLTYIPEEQIGSWHRHDTDGVFESVACVSEGSEDRLYAVIQRVVNGATVRYIERMASRLFVAQADAFFVDAGTTWSGVNTSGTTITVTEGPMYGDTTLKPYVATASAATFAPTDVGDVLTFTVTTTLADGTVETTVYTLTVTTYVSPTVVQGMPIQMPVPDPLAGQTFAGAMWGWKRKHVSGLTWLEGETVSVLGDGAVFPQVVVTNGTVTLQYPVQVVQIGLPIVADLRTLPLVLQVDGSGQGMQKNINRVWVKVWRSGGIFIGPDENTLTEVKQRTTETYGLPPALKGVDDQAEEVELRIQPQWQNSGQVFIRQTDPLPLSIVGLTLEVVLGD